MYRSTNSHLNAVVGVVQVWQCVLMMSSLLPQAWEGNGIVKSARKLIGATNPLEAEPGTIRGDLAVQTGRNVVHGSDSVENGEREIGEWPNWCAWF
jgi:nucleoside diphosphate kinase